MKFASLHHTDAPYHYAFGEHDLLGFEVFVENRESIGKVVDILIDDAQQYHLAVEHQSLLSQERFIIPVTACKIATSEQKVYVTELNKAQLKNLPIYHKQDVPRYVDPHASRSSAIPQMESLPVEASLPLEYGLSLETGASVVNEGSYRTVTQPAMPATTHLATTNPPLPATVNTPSPNLQPEPIEEVSASVVNRDISPERHPAEEHNVQLLAERLIVDRRRRKVGEVIVRKVIETQMVNVPVRREKLIVEQISPEHKSLAAIDLGHGELSQVELRKLMPDLSEDAIQAVSNQASNQASGYTASMTEAVPISTALQILQQITQVSQFKHTAVRLVFENEELQHRYQRWLGEHKN